MLCLWLVALSSLRVGFAHEMSLAVVISHTDVLNCLGKHMPDLGLHNTFASA